MMSCSREIYELLSTVCLRAVIILKEFTRFIVSWIQCPGSMNSVLIYANKWIKFWFHWQQMKCSVQWQWRDEGSTGETDKSRDIVCALCFPIGVKMFNDWTTESWTRGESTAKAHLTALHLPHIYDSSHYVGQAKWSAILSYSILETCPNKLLFKKQPGFGQVSVDIHLAAFSLAGVVKAEMMAYLQQKLSVCTGSELLSPALLHRVPDWLERCSKTGFRTVRD